MSSSVFFYEPFYDFDRLFDEAFNSRVGNNGSNQQIQNRNAPSSSGAVGAFKPRMDLHENSENNLVTATFELPGLTKQDVQIQVQNGRLNVSAESKMSEEFKENGFAVRERRYGKFARTLQLPQGVNDSDVKATMENGVLSITFPKTTPDMAPKKIAIS